MAADHEEGWPGSGPTQPALGIAKLFNLRRSRNVIYALAIFAGLALTIWRVNTLYSERRGYIEGAKQSALDMARDMIEGSGRALDTADLLAQDARIFIQQQGGLGALSPAQLHLYLSSRTAVTSIPDYLMVVDAKGYPLAVSERPVPPHVNLADRSWFKAHAHDGHDTYIGEAIHSRLGRRILYTYSKTLSGTDGRFEGVVDVGISARDVHPPITRKSGQPDKQLWQGRRLVLSNFMDFDATGNPLSQVAPFSTPPSGLAGFIKQDKSDLLTAYRRDPVRGLVATVTLRRSEILARWSDDVRVGFVLFALAVLIGGLLAKLAADLAETDLRARRAVEETVEALSAAIAQRDLLLKEIHHRVKNNLQLTSSLIQIQSREFDDDDVRAAFKEAQQRLFAIGTIHDALYHDNFKVSIYMRGYLSRLSSEIARANHAPDRAIRTDLDVDAIEMMPEQATQLGLVTSEVLISAYKQNFPDSGMIVIALHENDERVELTISTNATGGELKPETDLGTRLLKALTAQLHGESDFDTTGSGVFHLRFRKKAVKTLDFPA